jgi:hypothetical protein
LKEAIVEALTSLGGCGTIAEVREEIVSRYGRRWKDIGTAMADLCPESTSSQYPARDRVLKRVGRGRYCLKRVPISSASTSPPGSPLKKPPSAKGGLSSFSYRNAADILKKKGHLSTLTEAAQLTDLSSRADHDHVQRFLNDNGWNIEVSKFPVSSYRLDAFNEGIGVEIERSLIDAIHRSLFRCIWSYRKGQLEGLVLIVPTYKEPAFETVKRDIQAFSDAIPFPIYLIGVHPRQQ